MICSRREGLLALLAALPAAGLAAEAREATRARSAGILPGRLPSRLDAGVTVEETRTARSAVHATLLASPRPRPLASALPAEQGGSAAAALQGTCGAVLAGATRRGLRYPSADGQLPPWKKPRLNRPGI